MYSNPSTIRRKPGGVFDPSDPLAAARAYVAAAPAVPTPTDPPPAARDGPPPPRRDRRARPGRGRPPAREGGSVSTRMPSALVRAHAKLDAAEHLAKPSTNGTSSAGVGCRV